MSDEAARKVYEQAGLGASVTLGQRPAVLVIDFSCGFTDPACALSPTSWWRSAAGPRC